MLEGGYDICLSSFFIKNGLNVQLFAGVVTFQISNQRLGVINAAVEAVVGNRVLVNGDDQCVDHTGLGFDMSYKTD